MTASAYPPDVYPNAVRRIARVMLLAELPDDLTTDELAELGSVTRRTAERDILYLDAVSDELDRLRRRAAVLGLI